MLPGVGRTAGAEIPPPAGSTALAGGTTHATGVGTTAPGGGGGGGNRGNNAGAAETAAMRAVAGMKSLFIMTAVEMSQDIQDFGVAVSERRREDVVLRSE
jgi:hypothetical protein